MIKKNIVLLIALTLSSYFIYGQNNDVEERLKSHVLFFTSDSLQGRKAGSAGEKAAAEYLYEQLAGAGVEMLTPSTGQDFSIDMEGDTIFTRNIVGVVEGYDPKLKNEYVLIGANIDHIGTNILTIDGKKVLQVFPGADDNASGLSCLIEIAQRIASSSFLFKRSVIFAGFGASEMGMAGAWYFVNRAFPQIDDISMMLNLDMVGRSGPYNFFRYYTGVPNPEINSLIANVAQKSSMIAPILGEGETFSSDYLAFYEKNIPISLFTTGTHRDYHTVRDVEKLLDYESMDQICRYVYLFAQEVANLDSKVSVVDYAGVSEKEDPIYSPYDVDKSPQFFHGNEKEFLENWVYDYLKYPQIPMAMGIQGTVIVEFVVEKDGSVTNVKVVKSVDENLDAEAVRVVAASPKWKSGKKAGRDVRVKYSIPIEFKLKRR